MTSEESVENRGIFAFFAIVTGVLSLVAFVLPTVYSPHPASDLLPYFQVHRSVYIVVAITILMWMTAAIPFVVIVARLLGGPGRSLAAAAALSSACGILLVGFAVFAFVGALLAIVAAAGAAPNASTADYQAAVWSNLSFFLADPGLMVLGLGQLLFARLAWQSTVFSKSVAIVGVIGGVAGLLTLATYQTAILAIVQIAAFGVWAIATGVVLLRL